MSPVYTVKIINVFAYLGCAVIFESLNRKDSLELIYKEKFCNLNLTGFIKMNVLHTDSYYALELLVVIYYVLNSNSSVV